MRLRSILPLAAFLALAACNDAAVRPKIASKEAVQTPVTTPATPPQQQAAAGSTANCCACPQPATLQACPPAKASAPKMAPERPAPARVVKAKHRPQKAVRQHVERRYARVERPAYATTVERNEYARVERPVRVEPHQYAQRDYAREDFERREFERREFERRDLERRDFERREFERRDYERRQQQRIEEERRIEREYAWREEQRVYRAPPPPPPRVYERVQREERYESSSRYSERGGDYSSAGYPTNVTAGGCCVRPAAGRDQAGFLTWPGKR